MPWTIKKSKNKKDKRPWKIVNLDTGKVVGSSTSRKSAVGSLAHRNDWLKKNEPSVAKKVKKVLKPLK